MKKYKVGDEIDIKEKDKEFLAEMAFKIEAFKMTLIDLAKMESACEGALWTYIRKNYGKDYKYNLNIKTDKLLIIE